MREFLRGYLMSFGLFDTIYNKIAYILRSYASYLPPYQETTSIPFSFCSSKFWGMLSTITVVSRLLPILLISLMVSPLTLMVCSRQSTWLTLAANFEMTSSAYDAMLDVNIIISYHWDKLEINYLQYGRYWMLYCKLLDVLSSLVLTNV